MSARWHFVDRMAPSWLVVQLLGTAVLLFTLFTANEDTLGVWAVYAASMLAWLTFIVADPWHRRLANAALAVSATLPMFVVGAADDATALVMICVVLSRFASLTSPSGTAIVVLVGLVVAGSAVAYLTTGHDWQDSIGYPGMILLVTLLGLHRRQYELRTDQAEELLRQTELAQQERARAAALDERARIAREMHDVLAHSLGALGMQLKVAEALLSEKGDTVAALERVRRSNRLAEEGLVEARNAVAALRGDVPSLPDAVADLVDAFRRDHQTSIDLRVVPQPRPASTAATVSLVRTLGEALTNAAKHAPGEPVTVTLDFSGERICLEVVNGRPAVPPPPVEGPSGYGLTGMRERLALVGGTLIAGERDEGAGWRVTAQVPE
ncbi:sensor histidine kinase [Actinoplanes regularis]|uniref:histidine kinase n=1 Tax=Actinoplanes regularis TaxID=52697 RepID=A0A239F298_9ACTN|nr:sensor histidine kinase [Actinoplanes regularis]GIE89907.1 two-component sensor histidine kinase [Actinoplanes regularis]SNS50393.1 Signal transduction histidine kinase [Actinoplanes regularis]